eukprot:UC4_evm17s507
MCLPGSLYNRNKKRVALVIPAFETSLKVKDDVIDMCWLKSCKSKGKCQRFHKIVNPQEHYTTNYTRWWVQENELWYNINCVLNEKWEPYIVVPANDYEARYDRSFKGFGKNKLQYTALIRFLGYQFVVIKNVFIVHQAHYPSASQIKWLRSGRTFNCDGIHMNGARAKNDRLFIEALSTYKNKYGDDNHQLCNASDLLSSVCKPVLQQWRTGILQNEIVKSQKETKEVFRN